LMCQDIRTVSNAKWYFVRVALEEGKNRHIRRLLKALGYRVTELKRISFGPYKLGTIKSGRYMMQKIM
jgi:16S rRNA U516 pseudouridylate synthase RsuA-like enzyme